MGASITQQVMNTVTTTLQGSAPDGVAVAKGRKTAINEGSLPEVLVYWHQESIVPVGNPRRPSMLTRNLILEVKLTVNGTDEDWDFYRQWIIAAMWNAGTLGGLVKNLSEGETVPYLDDSSASGPLTSGAIRFAVEYTTLPGDLTAGI
jgi:hypothetical protein